MGIKERRTKILLALFLMSDIDFSSVDLNSKIQNTFDLFLNQKTKGTLSSLIKDGLIEKNSSSSATDSYLETKTAGTYKLTDRGFSDLCLVFPFFRFLKNSWDGKWRILSYEIPEKKRELRDKLRREVSGWGLGPWHRSFWVTPHPIIDNLRELVEQKEEEQYIQAFEAEHVFGDRNILIEKVWNKSSLDLLYRELFKKWHSILSSEGDNTAKFTKIINEYIIVLKIDPGLPKELIGDNWIGFEAFALYKEIRTILSS